MERNDAAKILQSLADGVDPVTGEAFPASSPYQRADVVRALFAGIHALESKETVSAPAQDQSVIAKPSVERSPAEAEQAQTKRPKIEKNRTEKPSSEKPRTEKPRTEKLRTEKPGLANAGRPWSQEEDARLGRAFDTGNTIEMLAQEHQRSRFAIEARLVKLGRIEEPSAALRFPLKKSTTAEPAPVYPV